ncbi:hypothetical protein AYI68_g6823, partial [Smittium mucronatum]
MSKVEIKYCASPYIAES